MSERGRYNFLNNDNLLTEINSSSEWGGKVSSTFIGKNLTGLKSMILKWIAAKISPFDIWEVHVILKQVREFDWQPASR